MALVGRLPNEMHLSEFEIGLEFLCGDRRWCCTDVGGRVVVAIRVDETQICTNYVDGTTTERVLAREDAEADGWFSGPPYAVAETVFDEHDQEGCEPVLLEV